MLFGLRDQLGRTRGVARVIGRRVERREVVRDRTHIGLGQLRELLHDRRHRAVRATVLRRMAVAQVAVELGFGPWDRSARQ